MLVFEAKDDLLIGKVQKLFDHSEKQKSETSTPAKKILRMKKLKGTAMRFHRLWVSLNDSRIELYNCDKQGIVKGHKLYTFYLAKADKSISWGIESGLHTDKPTLHYTSDLV